MNKKILLILVFVILLLLLGGYIFVRASKKSATNYGAAQPTKSASVFSSIADALTKNLSLQCDYSTDTMHTIAYIKNGMVRSDVTDTKDPSLSGSVIMRDKKIYYWNAQKMGFMMAMPEVTVTPPTGSATSSGQNGQNTLQNLEQYKNSCHTATVADGMFTLPSDVKFTDQTQMMRMIPTGAAPTTTSGNSYQQQAQQYMQQYHITPQAQ